MNAQIRRIASSGNARSRLLILVITALAAQPMFAHELVITETPSGIIATYDGLPIFDGLLPSSVQLDDSFVYGIIEPDNPLTHNALFGEGNQFFVVSDRSDNVDFLVQDNETHNFGHSVDTSDYDGINFTMHDAGDYPVPDRAPTLELFLLSLIPLLVGFGYVQKQRQLGTV